MLEELKEQVVKAAKDAERNGMCRHKSGNFSIRDETTGYVVISPSGISRDVLTADHICVMDLEGNVIERRPDVRPSSEVLMHLAIYRIREDIRALVHTHATYSTALAILNCPIPPIVYECAYLGKSTTVSVAAYGRPGTVDLAAKVADVMEHSDCCLMEKHGAIAGGTDMEDAFLKACYLEEISELYCLTLSAGGHKEVPVLPDEEMQKWAYPKEIKL